MQRKKWILNTKVFRNPNKLEQRTSAGHITVQMFTAQCHEAALKLERKKTNSHTKAARSN